MMLMIPRPRVILVTKEGQLVGLVTVKDVLRHEASAAHRASTNSNPSSATSPSHTRGPSVESGSNGWAESWEAIEAQSQTRGRGNGLEIALEEGLNWLKGRAGALLGRAGGRVQGRTGVEGSHEAAYEFEMDEERPG
jgi:chloride channel 3/4/5